LWPQREAFKLVLENQIILYNNAEGKVTIKVTYLDDTFRLPQKAIATLFGVEIPAISKHLTNIYETGELVKEATISILETVQVEGNREVKRRSEFYNLDTIIAVGYRVNSKQVAFCSHGAKKERRERPGK